MHQFTILPKLPKVSLFSKFLLMLLILAGMRQCLLWFQFTFPWYFHVPVGHLYVFCGKMSIWVFGSYFSGVACFLMLSCLSCLYLLDINSLWDIVCLVAQLCPSLCDPVDCSPSGSSVHGDSPGKNSGVGCHAFLQIMRYIVCKYIFLFSPWNLCFVVSFLCRVKSF